MATSEVEVEGRDQKLKHLGFMRILAINAVVLVSDLYGYAKQNSGALKSSIGKVENAVTAVVGPVYEKFKGVPNEILIFLDTKVDEATVKFDECAPPAAKNAVVKAQSFVKRATQVAHDLAEEAKVDGPIAAVSHAGAISKEFALSQIVFVWYKANQYPTLHGVFEIAVPTATHWSEKYNKIVKDYATKGYSFFNYVPLVPVEEMSKAYKQVEAAAHKKTDTGSSSESESGKD
ncbi:hypothetical protein ABFX02_05G001800 [Erythranthe guttata]